MAKVFKWDASVLTPESVDIEFNGEIVKFTEFSRATTEAFIIECIEKKVSVEEDYEEDGEKKKRSVRKPMREVLASQSDIVNKYLSKATKDVKAPKFFANLDLTANAYGHLVEMLMSLNHVEDILEAGGNWLVIPSVYKVREMEALANTAQTN